MSTVGTFSKLLWLVCIVSCLQLLFVHAYEDGAGACFGGIPAVGGSHLSANSNPTNIPLSTQNVVLKIGGVTIPEGGTATIPAMVSTVIAVTSSKSIKGVLIRIEAPDGYDTTAVITPGQGTQVACVCSAPVVGITHYDDDSKSVVSGSLFFPEPVNGTIVDLTIVWTNDQSSKFSYGQFLINVSPSSGAPVPTPADPTNVCTAPSSICFSSYNTVEVKDIGNVPLSQVKIGDYIKTVDNQYTQVYGFGHYDHERKENFLRMTFDDHDGTSDSTDASLEVSPQHFVFVKRHNGKQISMRAMDVVVGDQLGDRIVTTIETIIRRGVYAPLTQSGDMIVSGTYASNYVDLVGLGNNWLLDPHALAHLLFLPQRLFCGNFMETCKKEIYINGYGFLAYTIVCCSNIVKNIGWMTEIIISWINCPFKYLSTTESITSLPTYFLVLIGIVVSVLIGRRYDYLNRKRTNGNS